MAVFSHEHEAQAEHYLALAVGRHCPAANLMADLHVGDVADLDGDAVLRRDDDVLDLVDVRRSGRRPVTRSIWLPRVMLPPPTFWLFFSTASITSVKVKLLASSLAGSTRI